MLQILFCVSLLAIFFAFAQDSVHVTTVRDPVSKSYRKMVEGMDLFEKKRDMAPGWEASIEAGWLRA